MKEVPHQLRPNSATKMNLELSVCTFALDHRCDFNHMYIQYSVVDEPAAMHDAIYGWPAETPAH